MKSEARRVVLLVDGHADSRDIYRMALEHSGYAVLEAATGAAGLELARSSQPDAVVTELVLPDGKLDFIRSLKDDPQTRDLCVVAVTAQAFSDICDLALELGCARCMRKPLEPRALVAALDAELGRAPHDPA